MSLSFTKMHGLGNDFVVIDARDTDPALNAETIRGLCDRRFGIGCDQLVLLSAPTLEGADVRVRFFNPDGSEAGACGNASRCVVAFVGGTPTLQTAAGLLPTARNDALVTVDMGLPGLGWQDVPLARPCDTLTLPMHEDAAACSMGNPHATLFGDAARAETLGPDLECDPLFPERANIGFAQILSPTHMRLRVWERGAGLTLACGSGACAAVVNAVRRSLTERTCTVTMDGGDLQITWRQDGHVLMTGPAVTVFHGTTT
ncbi:diaminopimelate epimerase [Gluconobacter kanchanaburiensis]|uniref:Diaminopimelate epimerase n=1 Tax=Gluconobacter kanchanaburiensis NBRC 103587 TaxID=1307948 RepID=A0A511BA02_9PROT|nr:diaminopimelate epimerase [Gluconobacter kanchanaburiensis]MBF0862910.1 diaminopimelate epimerase [Gluconobacter kanchanaburiensis]GBR72044.1 diaminopimelate epimerase [Gluconobacter kanchanaburiensis NBRC 103587]GEK97164.1 diaminopimelate epimerase [Gluconobacter kanchanaburiensis NBRC 103587]